MRIIKPPTVALIRKGEISVFLAGSIEMGAAEDWQAKLTSHLAYHEQAKRIVVLNPRRDDWDSTWVQTIKNRQFRQQVEWELGAMQAAKVIALYFAPGTYSPISLMELGLHATGPKLVVCCPEAFWRKGNVDVVCRWYRVPLFAKADDWLVALDHRIEEWAVLT